jgi:hypothetical protein
VSAIEEELAYGAEAAGFVAGTGAYDRKVRELRVLKCRELQQEPICSACRAYMDCELIKQHLRDLAYGGSDGSST